MTIYDDMRAYVHTHDRNGWFDVIAKTTPMYQMIDKADAENAKLRELCAALYEFAYDEYPDSAELNFASRMIELGVEVTDA